MTQTLLDISEADTPGIALARQLCNAGYKAREEGRCWTFREVGEMIDARDRKEFPLYFQEKKDGKKSIMPDADWIRRLEAKACYAGIDIKKELGIAQCWSEERRVPMTRLRFLNWLAKAEKVIRYNGQGQSSQTNGKPNQYVEPDGWKTSEAAMRACRVRDPESWQNFVDRGWFNLAPDTRMAILRAMH